MSHGANPVIAMAFGLAALLTAGVANANCSTKHQSVSLPQTPATDSVVRPDIKTPGSTRG